MKHLMCYLLSKKLTTSFCTSQSSVAALWRQKRSNNAIHVPRRSLAWMIQKNKQPNEVGTKMVKHGALLIPTKYLFDSAVYASWNLILIAGI